MPFDLTIKCTKSCLNKFECIEQIHIDKLQLLINSNLLLIEPFNNFENEKQQLIKYSKVAGKVIYNKSGPFGRVYVKGGLGLQSLRKEIRHTLTQGIYIDIDIENAHPTILSQILTSNDNPFKYLTRYVLNREKYLTAVQDEYNVDRETAKSLFLRMLYGGTFDSWAQYYNIKPTRLIKDVCKLQEEIKLISSLIVANNPLIKKELEKGKNENIKNSSVLSLYLQEIENQILEEIYNYCVSKKYIKNNECVLCFDGIMILKENYKPELLIELYELIKGKFQLNLNFVEKSLNKGYMDEELILNQIETETDKNEYDIIKEDFEKNNFKIDDPLLYATIGENLILRNRNEFINKYENLLYKITRTSKNGIKTTEEQFVKTWLRDPKIRTYDKIDFLPAQNAPDNIYNTFKGFKASKLPLQKENITESQIRYHIKHIVCDNNDDMFNYFMKWLARMVQKPYDNDSKTAFCLKGVEGCGKDTIFNWFGNNILGSEYYLNENKMDLIFGRFNSCVENKILIVLNETSGKDSYNLVESIKNSITRDELIIEHKGLKPYKNKNYISYCFLTNNENPVKITPNERRFFCNECSDIKANNKVYFKKLYSEINSKEYDRAFYNYFMEIDIDNFDFINDRPITKFYENIRDMNIPPLAYFLEHIIDVNNDKQNLVYKSSILFELFREYMSSANIKYEISSTRFGIDINNYDGIEKKKEGGYMRIYINAEQLKIYLNKKYKLEFEKNSNTVTNSGRVATFIDSDIENPLDN